MKEYQELVEACVDPEDPRFMPFGFSLTEAFLLLQGMVLAMDRRPDADGDGMTDIDEGHQRILRTNVAVTCRDRHVLAAAVLIDLYMREKIDVYAWQLSEDRNKDKEEVDTYDIWSGPISNVYRVTA